MEARQPKARQRTRPSPSPLCRPLTYIPPPPPALPRSAYYHTHHNLFAYAANGLKSDFGGHHNFHEHNVYAWVTNCWGTGNADRKLYTF